MNTTAARRKPYDQAPYDLEKEEYTNSPEEEPEEKLQFRMLLGR